MPAYAHNDYENRRPLMEAIHAGYSGAEVDYYLVGGRLLVGHDAATLQRQRTLESLYLDPLRQLLASRNSICPPPRPFLLNIEAKQRNPAAADSLMSLLTRYADVVGPGMPVRVVLVGWVPRSDSPSSLSVHYRVTSIEKIDQVPSDPRVVLISVRYRDLFRWDGRGDPDDGFRSLLADLVGRAHTVPDRRLRIYEVPYRESVYRSLLEGGVDLIGVKDLARGSALLKQ